LTKSLVSSILGNQTQKYKIKRQKVRVNPDNLLPEKTCPKRIEADEVVGYTDRRNKESTLVLCNLNRRYLFLIALSPLKVPIKSNY
jgi:hypothetical protein